MQIVEKYYSGKNAHSYNQSRIGNSKWKAEQQYVENFIRSNEDIKTVIDAPAGTGRFHSVVETSFHVEKAYGYELSDDMLEQARFTNTRKWDYVKLDLINENIPVKGDLTVCIRMLNLINEEDALAITRNILQSSNKYVIVGLRHHDDPGDWIDEKVFCQNRKVIYSEFKKNFKLKDYKEINTGRKGKYGLICLERK